MCRAMVMDSEIHAGGHLELRATEWTMICAARRVMTRKDGWTTTLIYEPKQVSAEANSMGFHGDSFVSTEIREGLRRNQIIHREKEKDMIIYMP